MRRVFHWDQTHLGMQNICTLYIHKHMYQFVASKKRFTWARNDLIKCHWSDFCHWICGEGPSEQESLALLRWEQLEPTELPGSKLYTGYSSVITREYTLLAFHHLYKFFGGKISFMCQIKEVWMLDLPPARSGSTPTSDLWWTFQSLDFPFTN